MRTQPALQTGAQPPQLSTLGPYTSHAAAIVLAVWIVIVAAGTTVAVLGPAGWYYGDAMLIPGILVFLILLSHSIRRISSYEVGVVRIMGTYRGILRPGFHLVPPIAAVIRVDPRTQAGLPSLK